MDFFPAREAHLHGFDISFKLINSKISNINKNPMKYPIQYKEIFDFMFDENSFESCPEKPINIIDACHQKNEELALQMVKDDPKKCIEFKDDLNQNALHYAISNQMYSLIRKLILEGINYEQKSIANLTPIDLIFFFENEKDKIDMMRFLDNVFEKSDKINIEIAKEMSMEQIRNDEKKKEEQQMLELSKKKEKIQHEKNLKLQQKKNKAEIKKQKKMDEKNQNRELKNMKCEDTMYIEKELRIKKKEEENCKLIFALKKKALKFEKLQLKHFFFDCEKNDAFWDEETFYNQ